LKEFAVETWISSAARRVAQIQQVTHALKFSHPDAKGTSLSSHGNPDAGPSLVGTHTLADHAKPDVVGNAAALDVLKFLRLEVDGKSMLERAASADAALLEALPGDESQSRDWMQAFAGLTEPNGDLASHKLAKQLYWPLDQDQGDGGYYLLAPLFPSSLVHRVWETIRDDRFGDDAKAARQARKEKRHHDRALHEYPDLAVLKFGGTKPQNISQLNSERHGEAYLLAALPPSWVSESVRPPLHTDSVFGPYLNRQTRLFQLTKTLREFLIKVKGVNNVHIRAKVAELVQAIGDEVMQAAAQLQELPPGWSAGPDCELVAAERFWLDPDRALEDEAFAEQRAATDWRATICDRYGNWLNARIGSDRLPVGDPEHTEWKSALEQELRMLREELDRHE
ncbi:MAG: type I-F CRISPR-associated protein Csy1, partial [Thiohalocapsa sp.]